MSRIFPVAFLPIVLAMAFTVLTANLIAQEPAEKSNDRQLLLPRPDVEMKVSRLMIVSSSGELNVEMLKGLQPGSSFDVELEGRNYEAVVEVSKKQMYGRTVKGYLAEEEDSFFTISSEGDAAAGVFLLSDSRMLQLSYGGAEGMHFVAESFEPIGRCDQEEVADAIKNGDGLELDGEGLELDDEGLELDREGLELDGQKPASRRVLQDQTDEEIKKAGTAAISNSARSSCVAPPAQFDIAIAYTTAARIRVGGTTAIRTECMTAVAMAEQTFRNSGLSIDVNLVGLEEVAYQESGVISTDLNVLITGLVFNQGALVRARAFRSETEADFVALVISSGESTPTRTQLGQASCPNFTGSAQLDDVNASVNAVRLNATTSTSNRLIEVLVHEMGHNIGCNHTEGLCNPEAPNARGLHFSNRRGTIMDNTDTRIGNVLQFSNLTTSLVAGENAGTSTRNNAAQILADRNRVENMRLSRFRVFVDSNASGTETGSFQDPFDTVVEGVNQTLPDPDADIPELQIRAGNYSETLTITKPMIIRSCGGTATIGN